MAMLFSLCDARTNGRKATTSFNILEYVKGIILDPSFGAIAHLDEGRAIPYTAPPPKCSHGSRENGGDLPFG
jgi:hypothetical protein